MKETKKERQAKPIFIARSVDSTRRYFIFHNNNNFDCVESRICSPKCKLKFFTGRYRESKDSIFLEYHKNYKPTDMEDYLIKEPTGQYLLFPYFQSTIKQSFKIKRREE
jgi:hypothetical protein